MKLLLLILIAGLAFFLAHNTAHGRKPWSG